MPTCGWCQTWPQAQAVAGLPWTVPSVASEFLHGWSGEANPGKTFPRQVDVSRAPRALFLSPSLSHKFVLLHHLTLHLGEVFLTPEMSSRDLSWCPNANYLASFIKLFLFIFGTMFFSFFLSFSVLGIRLSVVRIHHTTNTFAFLICFPHRFFCWLCWVWSSSTILLSPELLELQAFLFYYKIWVHYDI
jgi:hypothetical protein